MSRPTRCARQRAKLARQLFLRNVPKPNFARASQDAEVDLYPGFILQQRTLLDFLQSRAAGDDEPYDTTNIHANGDCRVILQKHNVQLEIPSKSAYVRRAG
jgi:hypothetical protein